MIARLLAKRRAADHRAVFRAFVLTLARIARARRAQEPAPRRAR